MECNADYLKFAHITHSIKEEQNMPTVALN